MVVDNLTEIRSLAKLRPHQLPELWLRLQPGLAVATHHRHTQTGQHGSKFGMTREELAEAVSLCQAARMPLKGLHFHQGSNFRDPTPLLEAIRIAFGSIREMGFGDRWHFCPGGGWSVAYHEDELPQPDIEEYVRLIAAAVQVQCAAGKLPLPVLHLEPGRSLVARAGVAIYRVGTIKRRSERTWLLVDGGMADNPRHALYASKYSCLPVEQPEREPEEHVSIAGPYCESGDVLIEDLPMPRMQEGELLAVPASGAYQLSMSSNYNGARRPAVVWLEDGRARLIIRRETNGSLMKRDIYERQEEEAGG
jgi:diaminopimelate decarboxylase